MLYFLALLIREGRSPLVRLWRGLTDETAEIGISQTCAYARYDDYRFKPLPEGTPAHEYAVRVYHLFDNPDDKIQRRKVIEYVEIWLTNAYAYEIKHEKKSSDDAFQAVIDRLDPDQFQPDRMRPTTGRKSPVKRAPGTKYGSRNSKGDITPTGSRKPRRRNRTFT